MRHWFIASMLVTAVALGACAKKEEGGGDSKCDKARKESADLFSKAAEGWDKLHAAWSKPELMADVKKRLGELAEAKKEGVDPEKLPAITKRFEEYVKFKTELAAKAKAKAQDAAKACGDKDAKYLRAASQATKSMHDLSGVQPNPEAWRTIKAVADLEEAMEKAKAATTDAKNALEKGCAKE
jgi:hypothetical protein